MYIKIVYAIGVCLFALNGFSQTSVLDELLGQIEQNNTELKAYQSLFGGKQLEIRSGNNLPDPQLSGYYMPFGEHQTDNYTEFEISQSFEFPTVYSARNKWNKLKEDRLDVAYIKKRQEVLFEAKKGFINLSMLRKQMRFESERRQQSQKIYEQMLELFNKEQLGILDLNKAKITWIQEQFIVDQLQVEIQNQITELETLNGGEPLVTENLELDIPTQLQTQEDIWNAKLVSDPKLLLLEVNEAVALQYIKLQKNKVLPNIALGYNYQGVEGTNYSGLYGGLSIPLWNSKNKVKAAETKYEYQQTNTQQARALITNIFQQEYNQYRMLFNKYAEYEETISNLNSEELLFKAYSLGEYSYLEYYLEVQFYRNAIDKMLLMENQIQLSQAQLLIHQL